MTFSFFRSATVSLASLALIGLLIPTATLAYEGADQGKITIRVTDETGAAVAGNWFLYYGVSEKSPLVRNGAKGENFNFPAGFYFFEAQPASILRPYRLIRSENPQRLLVGGSITFSVQYFKTEEQKKAAIMAISTGGTSAEPLPVAPATVTPTAPVTPSVTAPPTPPAPATIPTVKNPTRTPLSGDELVLPAGFYTTSDNAAGEPNENRTMSLAVTGPSAMAIPVLLALSILLSAILLKRKNA